MCGIVGAVAKRNVVPILLEGLRRLEYRGYDSAGIAAIADNTLERRRRLGKVAALEAALDDEPLSSRIGIAHTRWATHGEPSETNAHPHMSGDDLAIVHNGIIENYEDLRVKLAALGYQCTTETDSEVIVHLIHYHLQTRPDLIDAVRATSADLKGAYALVVLSLADPEHIVLARHAMPVVIGLGAEENFVASDVAALLPVTLQIVFLEDGDIADVHRNSVRIIDASGAPVARAVRESEMSADAIDKGGYRHFMVKEIHEQPEGIVQTLEERISSDHMLDAAFGPGAADQFMRTKGVHIVACGTSYHAGMVARYFIEQFCHLPCNVEIASEYRYRKPVVPSGTLFVAISQSGETADTLAALNLAQGAGYLATLAICNVAESSLVRESDLVMLTRAGPEIGVASTKAFTTQLAALSLLVISLEKGHGNNPGRTAEHIRRLQAVPRMVEQTLALDGEMCELAKRFADKRHALFLGRGIMHPIAMEGALKLKEISYIHAEAYPAGELKHGPLALVDADMPVVAVAPNDDLLEKLKSNLMEVRARGGELIVFADPDAGIKPSDGVTVINMPQHVSYFQAPIVYTVPLQLLAYHAAVLKGTDVDQPRNLAKSVTVE